MDRLIELGNKKLDSLTKNELLELRGLIQRDLIPKASAETRLVLEKKIQEIDKWIRSK